jgi:hypothetical protein
MTGIGFDKNYYNNFTTSLKAFFGKKMIQPTFDLRFSEYFAGEERQIIHK